MSDLTIEVATSAGSMAELKERLDEAFQQQFPGGMMQRRWNGEVLELSGPGASGSIVLEGGRLLGQAELRPPASMMRGMIESKVTAALRAAAGGEGG